MCSEVEQISVLVQPKHPFHTVKLKVLNQIVKCGNLEVLVLDRYLTYSNQ